MLPPFPRYIPPLGPPEKFRAGKVLGAIARFDLTALKRAAHAGNGP